MVKKDIDEYIAQTVERFKTKGQGIEPKVMGDNWFNQMAPGGNILERFNKLKESYIGREAELSEEYGKGVCRFLAKAGVLPKGEKEDCVKEIGGSSGKKWYNVTSTALNKDSAKKNWESTMKAIQNDTLLVGVEMARGANKAKARMEANPEWFRKRVAEGVMVSNKFGLRTGKVQIRTARSKAIRKARRIAKRSRRYSTP